MSTAVDLGPGTRRLADLLATVGDDDLNRQTPCPSYTLGDLVEHIGGFAQAFTASARKEFGPLTDGGRPGDADQLEPAWRDRIASDLAVLADAWNDPEAWSGMTRIAGMDMPAEMVGFTVADEIVVHGWDVATALGRPFDADPAMVDASLEFLSAFASPDAPAGPDVAFGPSRPVDPSAPPLTRAVALAGRDPDWSPA